LINLLYSVPAAVLLPVLVALAVAVFGGGQIYIHRRFSSQDFVAHNEVGGIIIAVTRTLYAVVLGFLTVVVWQHFLEARELVVLNREQILMLAYSRGPPIRRAPARAR